MKTFQAKVKSIKRPVFLGREKNHDRYEIRIVLEEAPTKEWWNIFKLSTLNPFWQWRHDHIRIETTPDNARKNFTVLLSAIAKTNEEYTREFKNSDKIFRKEEQLQEELEGILSKWKEDEKL